MIESTNLIKNYKKKAALNDISFIIKKGVCGLIGENGAGKSTLFKILVGQETCSNGKITIGGESPVTGKLKMGYLPQKFDFFHNITVYESLQYLGILKGMGKELLNQEVPFWLHQVNLLNEAKKKTGALSGGMKQRLGIAQAFMGNPDYILLDEPTVGLDPRERLAFRNLINEIGMNKTILLATHIIDDVESACENILVLHEGSLLYNGTTKSFIDCVDRKIYTVRVPRKRLSELNTILDIISVKLIGDEIVIRFCGEETDSLLTGAKIESCTLEDAYFLATGMFYRKEDVL